MRDCGRSVTEQRSNKRRLKHIIGDLEQRLTLISAVVDTENRHNIEARLQSRLLEALLTARLAMKHMIESVGADDAVGQVDAGGSGGNAAFPGAVPMPAGLPPALEAPPSHLLLRGAVGPGPCAKEQWYSSALPSVPAMMTATDDAIRGVPMDTAAPFGVGNGDGGPLADGACPSSPLLERLQAAMDRLIDDLHAAEQQGAGCNSPLPPLAHRVRSSTMLANCLAVRKQPFINGRELYVWWLQRMAEASSALLDAGATAVAKPTGWGRADRCCEGSSGGCSGGNISSCGGDNSDGNSGDVSAAVIARLVELVHITVPQLIGHFVFHPKTPGLLELLASNLVTMQPGGAPDELWATWLEAMGLSEHQEFVLMRLHSIFESHMGFLQCKKQHLMAAVTSQATQDISEQADTLNALDAANFEIAVCASSTVVVALGAVLTPWQVLRMDTAAAPHWVPDCPTGLLDAVSRRAAQRQQLQRQQQC